MSSSFMNDARPFSVTLDWISAGNSCSFERMAGMLVTQELVVAAIRKWKKDVDNKDKAKKIIRRELETLRRRFATLVLN
ncbi:hypothetical protein SLA2020_285860 [Shorea laevis]